MNFFNFKNKIKYKKRLAATFLIGGGLVALLNSLWLVRVAKHHYSFMFDIFFIILVIAFLIAYKLSNYLADFKVAKNKSRIDIVFLSVFFILLFIPGLRLDNSIKSKNENRYLATYKPLINKNGSLNYNFGNDFEEFFNDRFFMRKTLISLYHLTKSTVSYKYYETNSAIYIKPNHYVLSKTHIPKESDFPKEDILKTTKALDRFQDFCNKNHIKLYVLVVPYNQHIYQEEIKPFDNPEGLKALNDNII